MVRVLAKIPAPALPSSMAGKGPEEGANRPS